VFDYRVRLEPEGTFIGTLNEDFAIESLPGDIFSARTTPPGASCRSATAWCASPDAQGQPPFDAFLAGRGAVAQRRDEPAVSKLRAAAAARLPGPEQARKPDDSRSPRNGSSRTMRSRARPAEQIAAYLAEGKRALRRGADRRNARARALFSTRRAGCSWCCTRLGSRVNKAWGLALRKEILQSFNFELQAAATDEALVLSLGPAHSFALDEGSLSQSEDGARDAGAGGARLADFRDALALDDDARAGRSAQTANGRAPAGADPGA